MNSSKKQNLLQQIFLCCLLLVGLTGAVQAQRDTTKGTYCNVFYVDSDNEAVLPFNDVCFVSEDYAIKDPTNVRVLGPIDGPISLFERYQWLLHFYLPTVREADRLQVAMPADYFSKALKMAQGKFFVTISDNRSSTRFDPVMDHVDFVTVSGSAKTIEWKAAEAGQPFASYKLQMDLRFRQVDRSGASPVLVGEPVRVKLVIVIEPKQ